MILCILCGLFAVVFLGADARAQNVTTRPFARSYRNPRITRMAPARPPVVIRAPTQRERIQIAYQNLLRRNNVAPMGRVENGEFGQVQERAYLTQRARQQVLGNRANNRGAVIGNGILNGFQLIQGLDPRLQPRGRMP